MAQFDDAGVRDVPLVLGAPPKKLLAKWFQVPASPTGRHGGESSVSNRAPYELLLSDWSPPPTWNSRDAYHLFAVLLQGFDGVID